jgi:hypothetical protein
LLGSISRSSIFSIESASSDECVDLGMDYLSCEQLIPKLLTN